jgi:hypothetical protein
MNKIFKYELSITDNQKIKLPTGSKVLSAISQENRLVVYALVNTLEARGQNYNFHLVGTGNTINPSKINTMTFLNSVQCGPFVWHVFYEAEEMIV